ncbi:glycosyl hydrolase family 8 [uncultured Clostridium sp.]|uniref:glycosyl hydrolase family 8 n=1 Tax=uncultured Clostridium sp. TaxID=59620 RepID=UPI002624F7D3|nr:glycosyl hydrolase family 8 [uncultured Clostridium sp.]
MKKRTTKIVIALFYLLLIFILIIKTMPIWKPIKIKNNITYGVPTEKEYLLDNFISQKLTDKDGGIKTNYLNKANEGIITRGDNVLSESEGFMLLYYLEENNREKFNDTYSFIKDKMILNNGLISWRLDNREKNPSTATIDDLRIIKALLLGSEKWGSIYYKYEAVELANSVYENLKNKDLLVDYKGSNIVTLSYIDIQALQYLSEIDSKWNKIYKKSQTVLNNGYISNEFPLYKEEYNIETGKYDNLDYVNTLNTTIIVLNKLGAGENVEPTVNWFTKELKENGAIYAKYNIASGKSITDVQSTAVYANLIQIARITNNEELYKLALQKFYDFQVLNKDSGIYGAFGNANTLSVYSFDNVNALLAFRSLKV